MFSRTVGHRLSGVGRMRRFCMAGAALLLLIPASASAAQGQPKTVSTAPYRHGYVPFLGLQSTGAVLASGLASANNLRFEGGTGGVGVTTGPEKVYLVFWGSQWGTQATNSSGYATFSGDPKTIAPVLQAFFAGLGTGGETWSGVMTQYCDGVALLAQSCPASNNQHVAYPTGGAIAGVWEDTASAAPASATGHQIGVEAVNAATHFGNLTAASNSNTQYVVISPTGTNPDNYKGNGFCAWHDYTGDTTLSGGAVNSPDGPLAFTNFPYVTDIGSSCGAGFVNHPGTDDGVTIVEGHEYAETITDQFPAGGWLDASGAETGDKCAWISSGQGAAQNITLTTGSFPVQSTWANDYNGGSGGCEVSHPIVQNGGGGSGITFTAPGNQTGTVGSSVSLPIKAVDAGGLTMTFKATSLPMGLSINASTGVISGTPLKQGTYNVGVSATDSGGSSASTSFTWTIARGTLTKVTVTNPGTQTTVHGTTVSVQIKASDSLALEPLTYKATNLPTGLRIYDKKGLITGIPTVVGTKTVTVTASDATGSSGSVTFSWTVS